jgi:cytochrome b subunit of formate dehydrogenase
VIRELALLLAAVVGAGAAHAQDCTTCHPEVHLEASVHDGFGCTSCHEGMEAVPHPAEVRAAQRGSAPCQLCHEAGADLSGSIHAPLDCQDCHGSAHEIQSRTDPAAPSSPLKQFQTCGVCHADRIEGYLGSPHARALLLMGLAGAPSCSSCHGSHSVLPASEPDSTLSRANAPRTCGTCHVFVLDTWKSQSAHGIGWMKDSAEVPVCTSCHPAHSPKPFIARSELIKTPENCGGCHDEKFSTYRDSFHGKATHLGFLTAAICSDCHTAHQNLPADDPDSSVAPAHLQATCGQCHGEVTAAFARIDPHADPSDPDGIPQVHWIWLLMNSLMIAVFGLFGLHDLLWLQRALVGWRRGEFPAQPIASGPHIRRFSRVHIRIHVIVVVTFLTLAATGLPLKHHAAPWAQVLNAVPGAIALTRVIHRLAALATFGYAAFYLAHLAHGAFLRRDGGLFWGWRSMVPRARDLADLWGNLRYFLYLAPRPRLDRWTYWEKFDFFAVFWGIPVIGASGLLLWFPAFFTHFVPGWVINAAFVVHSDEALLAVGFIFVFHFFHTHLPATGELPARPRDLHGRHAARTIQGGAPGRVRTARRVGRAGGPPGARTLAATAAGREDLRILRRRDRPDPGGGDLLGPADRLRRC